MHNEILTSNSAFVNSLEKNTWTVNEKGDILGDSVVISHAETLDSDFFFEILDNGLLQSDSFLNAYLSSIKLHH